ncbi:NADH-quinone oxidoreductase subunit A [Sphingobacterium sp. Mn56C]|uniref:NADH-quinone oxidoreductase subunit A n=1 Tax=Sphingobacterium sp. Mn56C TaxID=3395261 RepID=UPI003BE354E2
MDDHPTQLSAYGSILLMGMIGFLLVCLTIFLAKILAPHKPNPIKNSTYECGEETVGSAWLQFNPRFYVIALVFLLFDVELIFIFPWATVFGNKDFIHIDSRWGWFTLVEMAIFLSILIIGLVYVWKRGDLNWIKPKHRLPVTTVNIPSAAYKTLNERIYVVRDYKAVPHSAQQDSAAASAAAAAPVDTAAKSPSVGFKPRFKKPGA